MSYFVSRNEKSIVKAGWAVDLDIVIHSQKRVIIERTLVSSTKNIKLYVSKYFKINRVDLLN